MDSPQTARNSDETEIINEQIEDEIILDTTVDSNLNDIKHPPAANRKLVMVSIICVNFSLYAAMAIMAPFFPKEGSKKGVSSTISGLIFGVFSFVVMISSVVLGKIMPKVGVKFMFLSGIWLSGGANILFGTLDLIEDRMTFIVFCFIVRSVGAFGAACYITASTTYLIQLFPDMISMAFSLSEVVIGLAVSVAPAFGGFLYGIGGYGLPFYTVGLTILANLPISYFLIVDLTNEAPVNSESSLTYTKMAKNPRVIVFSIVLVTGASTMTFMDPTLEPHLRQFGITPVKLGLVFLAAACSYTTTSLIVGWISAKFQEKMIFMVLGLLLIAAGYLVLAPAPFLNLPSNMTVNTIAVVLTCIGIAVAFIPTFEAIELAVTKDGTPSDLTTQGLISGWWASFNSFGEVGGASLSGILVDSYGFLVASYVVAGSTLIGTAIVIIFLIVEKLMSARTRNEDQTNLIVDVEA